MSSAEDARPPGQGNDRALKAWKHIDHRLSVGFRSNTRHAHLIALNLIRRNRRAKGR